MVPKPNLGGDSIFTLYPVHPRPRPSIFAYLQGFSWCMKHLEWILEFFMWSRTWGVGAQCLSSWLKSSMVWMSFIGRKQLSLRGVLSFFRY